MATGTWKSKEIIALKTHISYLCKMKQQIQQLIEWHNATGVTTPTKPTDLIATRHLLRYDLMAEENDEYLQAWEMVDIADALGDMLYILVGTIVEHGLQDKIEAIFDEIHRSNMTKVVDGKVKRRADGKILKPEGYEKPNLKPILEDAI
jgi:predicted HAD superfamily Cof-like phosphohydrolase